MTPDSPTFNANRLAASRFHPHLLPFLEEQEPEKASAPPIGDEYDAIPLDENPLPRSNRYAIVFGLGEGKWIKDFFRQNQNSCRRLLIDEPDAALFANTMRRADFSILFSDPRVHWSVGPQADSVSERMKNDATEIGAWGVSLWINRSAAALFPQFYRQRQELVHRLAAMAKQNAALQIDRGFIIQHNILRNLPWMLRSCSLELFENRFRISPANVIGAGPSLDKNIDSLRQASPGVLLIATDTALYPLLKRNIQPHFIVSCDPLTLNARHFENVPSLDGAILAFLPEVNFRILEKYPHHPHLLCLHDGESKTLRRLARFLPPGNRFQRRMNAGYCAFSLARYCGCSPIILAGMDLAVSPQGFSHAMETGNVSKVEIDPSGKSASLSGNVEILQTPVEEVEGYYGGTAITFNHFAQTILKLEQEIAQMPTPVIDATEGGAKKRGAIRMSLKDALLQYPGAEDISQHLHSLLSAPLSSQNADPMPELAALQCGVVEALRQIRSGKIRLSQWMENHRQGEMSSESIRIGLQTFFSRWNDLLFSPGLDEAVDIGLSRWRFETQRFEWPQRMEDPANAASSCQILQQWLEGLQKDLEFFAQLYALALSSKTAIHPKNGS
ncbi:MAG: 6-hydroxymethylpterin diphosphokinase MptE-like protein [Candidatus Omnitrophota bacterium]